MRLVRSSAVYEASVATNADAIFNSPRGVTLGNKDGDVTFVEFFDYNCGYCKRAMSDMLDLMKSDPKLKVVLKEFPVLSEGSTEAAKVAVAVRMQDPGGKVRHAEITIGGACIMLADEHAEIGALSPATVGGSPVGLHLYVEDVDAVVARAVAAGATLTRPVADQFYGDRVGGITDPFGHRWWIATHKEDLSPEEIRRRAAAQGR